MCVRVLVYLSQAVDCDEARASTGRRRHAISTMAYACSVREVVRLSVLVSLDLGIPAGMDMREWPVAIEMRLGTYT